MINKMIPVSVIAAAISSVLTGCNVSNEKGLDEVDNISQIDTGLICSYPETIKTDSFGTVILDENGNQQCERVALVCSGQNYNPITHACEAKGRHPNAPLELAQAIPSYSEQEGEQFATLFFWDEDLTEADHVIGDGTDDLIIHAWNDADCNSYDPTYFQENATQDPENNDYWGTDWQTGVKPDGIDPNYGVYWTFRLLPENTGCFNFIIHEGDTKYPIEENMRGIVDDRNPDRMSYVAVGSSNQPIASFYPYYSEPGDPTDGLREISTDLAAHWFDKDVVLFNDENAQTIRLYYSQTMPKLFPGEGYRGVPYVEFERDDEDGLTDAQEARAMYRDGMTVFKAKGDGGVDAEIAKQMLRSRIVAVALDSEGEQYAGNLVQTAGVIDALYTMGDNDADEATLGIVYDGDSVTASVWAPTASDVKLKLYNDMDSSGNYSSTDEMAMTFDDTTGIWSYTGSRADLDRKLFRYNISVFHPLNDNFENYEVIDPYAVSLTTNGRYARFVDLNDADLKPENWDTHTIPTVENPEDIVIYEGHIRDFSIMDESTPAAHRGKYLAFTHNDSAPVQHLKALADAGLTHFQVLPANDIATVDENMANRLGLYSTVGELCAENSGAEVCSFAQDNVVLKDLLETYSPTSERGRNILNALKDLDGFNWGYDPYAFNAPEGSYATNPEDTSRILEMRSMVQALHDIGLRASLDVVYNHTSSSGLWDNSVLDKIVPGYYHRLTTDTGEVLNNSCCQDTATEHAMMAKLMKDTLVSWSANFKFDAFRFDLMNLVMKDAVLDAREAVEAIDSDTYFYGEGWLDGAVQAQGGTVVNMPGTSLGMFSDVQRDGVRNGALFNTDGNMGDIDRIRIGLVGNIADYTLKYSNGVFAETNTFYAPGRSLDPADTINYVDKHDNETLWDQLQYSLGEQWTAWDRTRAHVVAGSFPLLSQGIPFMQMGSDLLRSKSMDRNTYNGTDWLNKVDFTKNTNNWGVSLPIESHQHDRAKELLENSNIVVDYNEIDLAANLYQDLLKVRASSKLFRLNTAEQIKDRVGFHNVGTEQTHGVVVMSIDDGAGCINGTTNFAGECNADTDMRADLDPNFDAIVVVFNGTQSEQTMSIPTAAGFTLHSTQIASADNTTASASFDQSGDNGQFTVPALTTAVFVKVQSGAQGTGLNSYATVGAPDIPPYDATTVLLRGDMNSWGENLGFEYIGEGKYRLVTELAAGTYNFKVAEAGWSYPNLGGGFNFVAGDTNTLVQGSNDNLSVTVDSAAKYVFELDASDPQNATLTFDLFVERPPFGANTVYIKGSVNANAWSNDDPMLFVGEGKYVTSIYLTAGSYQFKFADANWTDVNFGSSNNAGVSVDGSVTLDGGDNVSLTIAQDGEYLFTVDASDTAAPVVSVALDTPPHGGETAYLRGFDGQWDAVNAMDYYGGGYYAIDITASATTASTSFKVADANWGSINYGLTGASITAENFGETYQLVHNENDISLAAADGTQLRFIFKLTSEADQTAEVKVIDLAAYQQ